MSKHALGILIASATTIYGQVLYIANNGDKTVSSYIYDQGNGSLSEILPRTATTGTPTSVAVHPSGQFAYVTTGGPPTLAGFSIDPGTGALTAISSTALPGGSNPQEVVIDSTGQYAVIAHPGFASITVLSIDPSTGATTPVTGSPFASPVNPQTVVVHPNGFVYAAGATGGIAGFSLAGGGSQLTGSPFAGKNNIQWMAIDAAGKFLFVVERQDPGILVYAIDSTSGALTPAPGSPFLIPTSFLTGIAVAPSGRFLYVSNGGGVILSYSIGANGALKSMGFAPSLYGSSVPIIDPSGQFLYVPGGANVPTLGSTNAIGGYTIDPNSGALTSMGDPIPAGVNPLRGAAFLFSTPILAPISADSVSNYFSHAPAGIPNWAMAQGSRIAIQGKNIGPPAGSSAVIPLSAQLGGVSVQIQSGDTSTPALMVYASNTLVTCVIPSTTPLGDATLTVTYNGRTTNTLPITIVPTSPGLRARNDSGYGPSKSWNVPLGAPITLDDSLTQIPNLIDAPAVPGQAMVITGTGLGAVSIDATTDTTVQLNASMDIFVGNKPATLLAAARGAEGTDFIVFQLPDDTPLGCYVPVAVRSGGVLSNFVSISVSASGGSCGDASGLAPADIDAAVTAGGITAGVTGLQRFNIAGSPQSGAVGRFVHYNLDGLRNAYSPVSNSNGIEGSFAVPPFGTCTVTPGAAGRRQLDIPPDPTQPQAQLNVGSVVNLTGPNATFQLLAPDYQYGSNNDDFTPGGYTVDNGAGNASFGAFKGAITIPQPLSWTNQSAISTVDRTQDLAVTWTGGQPDQDFILVVGLAQTDQAISAFLCTERVSAGQLTVPAWVLTNLPAGGLGVLGMGTAPVTNAARFTAAGMDFSLLTYEQAVFIQVAIQ